MWHIDGYDELKPYGFPIHGCIDGLVNFKDILTPDTRKIVCLKLSSTNNDPAVTLLYYLTAVYERNGMG